MYSETPADVTEKLMTSHRLINEMKICLLTHIQLPAKYFNGIQITENENVQHHRRLKKAEELLSCHHLTAAFKTIKKKLSRNVTPESVKRNKLNVDAYIYFMCFPV